MTKTIAIMAAGKGTRMLPLTKDLPKPLILINGKPFLHHLLTNVKKAGYEDIIVIVGYLKEKVEEFLVKGGWDVKVIEQTEILGSGSAVKLLKDEVEGDFVVINGDNLFSVEDLEILREKDNSFEMLTMETKNPEKYGVLVVDGDKLIKLVEKPKEFMSNLINLGAYHFTQDIFGVLDNIKKTERGEYEIVDAISLLAKENRVKILKIEGNWLDLGCPEDIPKLENFLKGK